MSEGMTKAGRVLKELQTKRRVTNSDLNKIAFRFGSIIHGLRKEGHDIVTERISNGGLYIYHYKGMKQESHDVLKKKGLLDKIKSWF